MSLKDEIVDIGGKKRRFLLLRIADIEVDDARNILGIPVGTYNSWVSDGESRFVQVYRRRDDLSSQYKEEAIILLRRDNQRAAVLLEEKIIEKIKAEIESGVYNLVRTNIARDVLSKLLSNLDYQPQNPSFTWEQRLQQLFINGRPVEQVGTGGNHGAVTEATNRLPTEHQEGRLITQGEQTNTEVQEEVQS